LHELWITNDELSKQEICHKKIRMPVLVNFKICDNAEECGGIEVCQTGALSWDTKNKTIKIDNSKCISCGKCENGCDVGAIRVAKDQNEFEEIKKEIEEDDRTISDLFVDRYGSQPVVDTFLIREDQFNQRVLKSTKLVTVEIFSEDSIQCMIKSIPIKYLLNGIDTKYQKLEVLSKEITGEYNIKSLPALIFFKNGKLVGKIEGYYSYSERSELTKKIKKIIRKKDENRY